MEIPRIGEIGNIGDIEIDGDNKKSGLIVLVNMALYVWSTCMGLGLR